MPDGEKQKVIEDGRQAFSIMMAGLSDMARSMQSLAQSNMALATEIRKLAVKDTELQAAIHAGMAHSAALQKQIGVLVQVMSGPGVLPAAPPPDDPFGRVGRRIVEGALNGIRRPVAGPPGS